jgi:hypothetical protein
MRKLIVSALAVGALAVGGAASAQDLGAVLGSVLGFGTPQYGYNTGTPAVVAGAYPSQIYVDPDGRQVYVQPNVNGAGQVYVDPDGRQVYVQPNTSIIGYDAFGRPLYNTQSRNYAYSDPRGDRDGDGVRNRRDRYPDDPRYR